MDASPPAPGAGVAMVRVRSFTRSFTRWRMGQFDNDRPRPQNAGHRYIPCHGLAGGDRWAEAQVWVGQVWAGHLGAAKTHMDAMARITALAPIIAVSNLVRAERFYTPVLGFEIEARYYPGGADGPGYVSVRRGQWALHLSSFPGDGTPGMSVLYLRVDDIDRLRQQLLGTGVLAQVEILEQSWGQREIYLRDDDGNALRFGANARTS